MLRMRFKLIYVADEFPFAGTCVRWAYYCQHDANFRQSLTVRNEFQINTDPMKSQMGYLDVVGELRQTSHCRLTQSVLMCNKRSTTQLMKTSSLPPPLLRQHSIHFNFLSLPVYCLIYFTAPKYVGESTMAIIITMVVKLNKKLGVSYSFLMVVCI